MKIFEVYILLYLVVSASSFTIHLYYLSETVSILPMFHLLFRWIIVESSDVFGYRVWILTSLVVSSWTGRLASWSASCCQHLASWSASCQIVLSASWFLQGSHPCWLLFILLVHSRYCSQVLVCCRARVPVGRSPSPDSLWSRSVL
jgi:hypothetical protein